MKRKLIGLSIVIAALAACSDDDDNNTPVPEPTPQASIRAAHLSADAPAVDVSVNGSVVLEDVVYRAASGFLMVDAADTDLQVLAADTDNAVIDETLSLSAETKYSVLAINNLASIEPLVIEDMNTPAAGFTQVRVVHAAPDVPAVDIYISAPDADFASLTATLSGVAFRAVSDELEVDAGDYRVRATLAGQTDVVFDSGSIALADGVEYVVAATPVMSGLSPIGLTILTDAEATPVATADDARARVRVVHASADAPNVDVSVDGAEVLADVPFPAGSDYLQVLGDTYDVNVTGANSANSVIRADLEFMPQQDYTVVALNSLAMIEALVLNDDNSAPADGNIKLRLVHAASTAGLVDIYITAPSADIASIEPNVADFAFKADTGYLEVPAGDYQVRITVADTKTVAIDTGTLSLTAGDIYTALALDPAPASTSFGVLLLEDND